MARFTWYNKDFTSAAEESFKKGLKILLAIPVYTAKTLPPTFLEQLQASKDSQSILAKKTELFLSRGNESSSLRLGWSTALIYFCTTDTIPSEKRPIRFKLRIPQITYSFYYQQRNLISSDSLVVILIVETGQQFLSALLPSVL
jgi:hypothetical protein